METKQLIRQCIAETKKQIRESVRQDYLIIQSVRIVDELNKSINSLTKRLRDWYALYNPETEHAFIDNEAFVKIILSKPREELLKQLSVEQTMGADLNKNDLAQIDNLAKAINQLILLKGEYESYQKQIVAQLCPNSLAIAGSNITARLIELAGGFERLSKMTSSTVQLLGAEFALFRHLKTGAKPPKYGVLHEHPLIAKHRKNAGRVARALADKLAIATKVDFFNGTFIGTKLRNDLEKKFGKW